MKHRFQQLFYSLLKFKSSSQATSNTFLEGVQTSIRFLWVATPHSYRIWVAYQSTAQQRHIQWTRDRSKPHRTCFPIGDQVPGTIGSRPHWSGSSLGLRDPLPVQSPLLKFEGFDFLRLNSIGYWTSWYHDVGSSYYEWMLIQLIFATLLSLYFDLMGLRMYLNTFLDRIAYIRILMLIYILNGLQQVNLLFGGVLTLLVSLFLL